MAYNRWLSKYYLEHHQVLGAHWGVHNGPPYPLDRSKSDGHRLLSDGSPQGKKKLRKTKTVFVSGSSKTQDPQSGYYRGELPKDIRLALREHIRNGNKIIVGDAPGIDRQVQDYLKKQKYDNVEIYGPGKEVRYSANPKWKTNPIDDPDHEPGSKEWLAKKDIAMTEAADEGLAIILDDGAKATRNNVRRLLESQKAAKVYSLNKDGTDMWADEKELMSDKVVPKTTTVSRSMAKANKIYDTLSDQEKYFLTAEENAPRYINPGDYNKKHSSNVYSIIEQYKDTPVSVIDIWQNEDKIGEVSIAVRNGTEYRHKGYASRAVENALKYFYNNPEMEYLVWGVNAKNRPSIELAKKYGFTFFEDVDGEWHTYVKDKEAKHTMAYNRWQFAAPPSDDDLLHYGVLGMRWGVRKAKYYQSKANKFADDSAKKAEYQAKYEQTVSNLKKRSRSHLEYFDKKYRTYQDTANRKFSKADRKSHGLFKNEKAADRAFGSYSKNQRKANRLSEKEERFYKEMVRSYKDLKLEMDDDLAKKGEEIIRRRDYLSMAVYADRRKSTMKHSVETSSYSDLGVSIVEGYLANEVADGFDLVHHGRPGQKWGVQNGPPYPLERQKKFAPDGKMNPSAYKKAQKTARAERKAIRKANPNGTPEDRKEKYSLKAKIKRAYRDGKREEKERAQADFDGEKTLTEKNRTTNKQLNYTDKERARADFDGTELSKTDSEREAAKLHGTAEEVMKFRESFTTEEWNKIADRLQAEERVRKFLKEPVKVESDVQNDPINDDNVPANEKKLMKGLSSKDRKLYKEGDARTIYNNRTKFNVEQLRSITNRLKAEYDIGDFANKQVNIDPDSLVKLKTAVKYMEQLGKGAQSISKIMQLIDPTLASSGKKNNGSSAGNLLKWAMKQLGTDEGSKKSKGGNKQQQNQNQNNQQKQDNSGGQKQKYKMDNINPKATYVIKYAGSDKTQRVGGSKLENFLNSTNKEIENVYAEDKKKK